MEEEIEGGGRNLRGGEEIEKVKVVIEKCKMKTHSRLNSPSQFAFFISHFSFLISHFSFLISLFSFSISTDPTPDTISIRLKISGSPPSCFHQKLLRTRSSAHAATSCAVAGGGIGMMALQSLLLGEQTSAADRQGSGSASQPTTHFAPRAKRMIWLFMHGGPSHVDLFDPKPELTRYAGQPLPESFGKVMTRRKVAKNPLLAPIRPFRPRGESGLQISRLPAAHRRASPMTCA